MQSPAFASLQSRYKSFNEQRSSASPTRFFENHPVGDVLRSLFFSSILWMLLAIVLYGVYTMVASR
jgi:hypothetical protein